MGVNYSGPSKRWDVQDLNNDYSNINFDFIAELEGSAGGGAHLGYTPAGTPVSNSGITVGMGVDLARLTVAKKNGIATADGMQISNGLYTKIQAYSGYHSTDVNGLQTNEYGVRGQKAVDATAHRKHVGTLDQRRNVILTTKETKELNKIKTEFVYKKLKKDYDENIGMDGSFDSLPESVKTTIFSMGWNMGENFIKNGKDYDPQSASPVNRKYYNALAAGQNSGTWDSLVRVLMASDWSDPGRRNKEGIELKKQLDKGN